MRSLLLLLALALPAAVQTAPPREKPTEHTFTLKKFHTESGAILPEATIHYGTYGTLNAAHSNAILLPSHYMAGDRGYEWLMGPGNALDPAKTFLITSELFGNGHSSSPSNTPEPFHGPRFPRMTIRDNVEAVHALLASLGITHLQAVIGFSMGAQQAFQWAVSYPTFMDRIVATSGTAKTYGHGIVRLEGQIAALEADQTFNGGDYTSPPKKGLEAFGMVWAGWLFSQQWWREELWRTEAKPGTTFDQYLAQFRNFIPGADANNLILQCRTWESNDAGATPGRSFAGDIGKALASIKVPVLYMPSATDLYFPLEDAQYEAKFIPNVQLIPIPSLWGHPAGAGATPADKLFLNQHISAFLAGK